MATDEQIAHMVEHSYRDFHAKGVDYLCLSRTPELTRKVYFFDEVDSSASDVVAPHDHRYRFETTVLQGVLTNVRYRRALADAPGARAYEQFAYMTPLNGGAGFAWETEAWLEPIHDADYFPSSRHHHDPHELHTIRVTPFTVIVLDQFEDIVPLDQPTRTWLPAGKRQPPSLDGLYSRMDADRALWRLQQYEALRAAL